MNIKMLTDLTKENDHRLIATTLAIDIHNELSCNIQNLKTCRIKL